MYKQLFLVLSILAVSNAAPVNIARDGGANAYTGAGGQANGGNLVQASHGGSQYYNLLNGKTLDVLSGDAGNGGDASSGNAFGGVVDTLTRRDGGSNAYTGVGGQANGGNLYKTTHGLSTLNILSSNAGHGGDASSGSAFGGIVKDLEPRNGGGNAYTGVGGQANGGNLYNAGSTSHNDLPLNALNTLTGNAGNGGDASSGNAYGGYVTTKRDGGANAYTGAGGQANGGNLYKTGSSTNPDLPLDMLNTLSGNAGHGGDASSGNAYGGYVSNTRRDGGANAYTGVGGQANGGNLYKSGSSTNHDLPLDMLNTLSGNAGNGGDASSGNAYGGYVSTTKRDGGANAYTGVGGQANGGNLYDSSTGNHNSPLDILDTLSGNAGHGGDASSGKAFGGYVLRRDGGGNAYTGVGGQANGGNLYESTTGNHNTPLDILNTLSGNAGHGGDASSGNAFGGYVLPRDGGANAYTGVGGQANGGNLYDTNQDDMDILNVLSNNAGDGGDASSGDAFGGHVLRRDGANAYTGAGGQANGGNRISQESAGLINLDMLNIGSDNAGNGGDASSGNAVGGICNGQSGNGGGNAYTGVGGQANGGSNSETSYAGLLNLHALNIGSHNAGNGGKANSGNAFGGSC